MTPGRFAGRRALVTGASRGIGAAVAQRLGAEGAAMAIVARTLDRHDRLAGSLNETAAGLRAIGATVAVVAADLADEADRARLVPEAIEALGGPIDILVNNTAAALYAPLAEFPLKRRRLLFEVNVHAPLDLAQAVLPGMRTAGQGWIVNVSSGAARPWPGPPFDVGPTGSAITAYGASKAALNRETNGLAVELHGTGIRVNTIEPRAAVLSEGARELVGATLRPDQIESMEEMVEAVVALCDCDEDVTGRTAVSLDLIDAWGLTVHALDGGDRSRALAGRVALVTGAGQGVGAGIARVLADQGAQVVVNDLFADRAETVAEAVGGRAVPFDVTDLEAVRAGFAEIGPVDILVNNAGIPAAGFPQIDFKDSDPELWHRFIDLNLYGVMHCTHTALPGMCDRGWGRVITISSEAGRVGLPIRVALYGAAKAGAIGLMKHLAHEVGRHGVTCNALALGAMEGTPMDPSRTPVPRLGTGADVGAAVAFLASDGGAWITGQVLAVNGGAVT